MFKGFKQFIFGSPLNPLNPKVRSHISLIAFFAWVGLGADALSSSCYGPEEAYLALGQNYHLALYVAVLTVITIFVIALGYNQVIELFPSGGGGYKVATKLLHPYAGVVAGSALVVDYVLTIAVSIASGTDAIFSFLPISLLPYKLYAQVFFIFVLLMMNMRGKKEAIQFLMPIFLGFVIIHFVLIIYGITTHSQGISLFVPHSIEQTHHLAHDIGWFAVIGLTLHAYSLGSGTFTGLESVSNNVQQLAEPRVTTGKRTMLYMAISLSFTAGGIMLLYLLWSITPVPGKTLNAVVFQSILGDSFFGHLMLIITLIFEAGLLFVAANSGFAAGPPVLANLATDSWLPNRFKYLSSRLAEQNGLLLFGMSALAVLIWSEGSVAFLVVLYSINVFITFTLSLLGISVYWARHRATKNWYWHLLLTGFATLIAGSILCITIFFKFADGGWVTLVITSSIVAICFMIKRHYQFTAKKLKALDKLLEQPIDYPSMAPHAINPQLPTAIIFVNSLSVGMHTLLSILRLFPNQFKNFVFLSAGAVDTESFRGQEELEQMQADVNRNLDYFVRYCNQYEIPADAYAAFGTDPVEELEKLADKVSAKYPNSIFFASQLIFPYENVIIRFLHNHTPLILQHYLHFQGKELMILPMKI